MSVEIKAFIMIQVKVGKMKEVLEKIRKVHQLEHISVVTGDWDIILKVMVKSLEDLLALSEKIQVIENIERLTTYIVEKEISVSE
jgi:DNA-binding Lrp family transcriptional regulator